MLPKRFALVLIVGLVLSLLSAAKPATADPGDPAIAFGGSDGAIYVTDTDRTYETQVTADNAPHRPAWSPDGRFLAHTADYGAEDPNGACRFRLDVTRVSDGARVTVVGCPDGDAAWSPLDDQIAYCARGEGASRDLWVMPAPNDDLTPGAGEPQLLLAGGRDGTGYIYDGPTWSPTGDRIAVARVDREADYQTEIVIYRLATGNTEVVHSPDTSIEYLDWSRNGDRLAFEEGGDVYTFNLITAEKTLIAQNKRSPTWSPDDSQLLMDTGTSTPKFRLYKYTFATGVLEIFGKGSWPDWRRDPGLESDTTPPDAVANLMVDGAATTHQSMTLTWTATGDDGTTGQAALYDVRYSLDGPMTEEKWFAEPLNKIPVLVDPFALPSDQNIMSPGPSGAAESLVVSGLAADTTYYFGIKVGDDAGNWSELALASAATRPAAPGEWAIDVINPDCAGGCGQRGDVDADATGRIGTWFEADGFFSHSYRDAGSATWQHELAGPGLDEKCLAFAYGPDGSPWASTCKDGPLQVMQKVGSTWVTETVDGQDASPPVTLVIHPDTGEPHMAFRRGEDPYGPGGSVLHAWRGSGTWHVDEVQGSLYGLGQPLALHPTGHYPSMAYSSSLYDGSEFTNQIYFAEKIAGSWSSELVAEVTPARGTSGQIAMAYHPTEHYPAVAYSGPRNESLFYKYRTEAGWTDAQVIDSIDPSQTGSQTVVFGGLAFAFGHDGTAYALYRLAGDYEVVRVAANDGAGWQIVHQEASQEAWSNDAAVNPLNGMPLFMYGYEPPKIIELLPSIPEPGITVAPTSGLVTSEGSGTDTFTVRLDEVPTSDVTIGLSSSDTTEGTVSPASLTFTAADWSTPQTVTVTGVDDTELDGDVGYSIVTATAASADPAYDGLDAADVSVTNQDDDAVIANLHVGDLDSTPVSLGNKWLTSVTIRVHDDDHNPVANATVTGSWIAGATGSASCTTDGSGACTVTSGQVHKNVPAIAFAVNNVSHASLTYVAADNHDPDGDSDGTSISVNKP